MVCASLRAGMRTETEPQGAVVAELGLADAARELIAACTVPSTARSSIDGDDPAHAVPRPRTRSMINGTATVPIPTAPHAAAAPSCRKAARRRL